MIIAPTNRKGGVGKSTVTTHLAAGLAILGYNVGMVDTDSQGHTAETMGLQVSDDLYELMTNTEASIHDHVQKIPSTQYSPPDHPSKGNLYAITGADNTYRIANDVNRDDPFAFLQLMDDWRESYQLDYIVVDTSPTLKELDAMINLAIDGYIYVTEAESLAIHGVDKAFAQLRVAFQNRRRYLRRPTTVLGVLPNKVRPRTDAHQVGLDELKEKYGELLWRGLVLRILWAEASMARELLYTYAPSSIAAREAWMMVSHTVKAIEAWTETTKQS